MNARLTSAGACLLVGESGSGKSALLKEIATAEYPRTIWFSAEAIDYATLSDFERAIGLRNPLLTLLRLAPDRCLVVFDGVENFSERGLRIAARLTNTLLTSNAAHVHIAFSVQFQAAERKILTLAALGVTRELLQITPLSRPDDDEIQPLLQSFPNLQWIGLRPELRPLLSNLKVLDWFARTQPRKEDTDADQLFGLTAVIDRLWTLWTEGPADGLARSHLLMNLAAIEADNLSRGLPRTRLGAPEQATLPGLESSGLIRIRDDQVLLAHDLLGDWARLRVLVAEDSRDFVNTESRAASPKWQQAIRLFGQRLLETSINGQERWRQAIQGRAVTSALADLMRDLFLDALVLSTNSVQLLLQNWDFLIARHAAFLNRLLDRFLIIATLPDPRTVLLLDDQEMAARIEHLFRVPFWPYWGPLLTVLHDRRSDVVRLAPYKAARLCELWLRVMPVEFAPQWREQAAEIALEIAREIQARNAEDRWASGSNDRIVYEAALYAAPHFPDAVSALSLELAGRKNPPFEVVARAVEARRRHKKAISPTAMSTPIEASARRIRNAIISERLQSRRAQANR